MGGRDVEYDVVTNDKTDAGLAAAEAKFKASQERIRKESKKTSDENGENLKKGVTKAAPGIIDSLKNTFGLSGAAGGQALLVGVGAAAPLIGSLLSTAVIGGAAGVGIVGGALLAARDPRVRAAGAELSENLLGQLERDAAPFVEPLLKNIAKVEIRFGQMDGRIKSIFAKSSGYLDPLVDGLLNGVDGILRGVDKLVAKAGPVVEGLAKTFDRVGNATGDAFEIIAGGSDEAAEALDDVSRTIEFLIVSSGYAIRTLTELYGVITYLPRKFGELERSLLGWEEETTAAATTTSALATVQAQMGKVVLSAGEAAGDAGKQMITYAERMDDAATKGRGLYDSQTDVAQAVADAEKAIKDNGKTLDVNTQKGRENRTALSNLAGQLTGNYDAYVKLNGEGKGAQTVAENNRTTFIRLATQLGLSKKAAGELATQMGLIPADKNTDFHANTHDAEARIEALEAQIRGLKGKSVTLSVNVGGTGRLAAVEATLNRLGGRGLYAGGMSWAALDSNSGVSRTGGPTPVNVNSSIAVSLDGAPFYAMTAQATSARSERDAWRQRTGKR